MHLDVAFLLSKPSDFEVGWVSPPASLPDSRKDLITLTIGALAMEVLRALSAARSLSVSGL